MSAPDPVVLRNVVKTYGSGAGAPTILGGITLTVADGEIVAILGQSGCGKSTLLRIIAGLMPATSGDVLYRGKPVTGPMPGVAMVFQSFALFPWMTVLENVAFGLEAQGLPAAACRDRAWDAISLIGLDGYENAYPKELSGGMRQRVGFARALVVNPDVLLLDEPFSALDVLTAETLRGDLMGLWSTRKIPTRGIVFVSHNIGEAVEVADRIIVLQPHPGRIRADVRIKLLHPRDPNTPAFKTIVDEIYRQLAAGIVKSGPRADTSATANRLPTAGIQPLLGLIDVIDDAPFDGKADFAALAEHQGLEMDDLFELAEAMQLLGFAAVTDRAIELKEAARGFHNADLQDRKRIFGEHLMAHVPLIRRIREVLAKQADHKAREGRILTELAATMTEKEAQAILETAINWARYAELFSYDYNTGILCLDPPETEDA